MERQVLESIPLLEAGVQILGVLGFRGLRLVRGFEGVGVWGFEGLGVRV